MNLSNPRSQTILLHGESGSGKSDTAKRLARFLIESIDDQGLRRTNTQILRVFNDSNIVLEAFGNAATIHNDNSSRHGKFIKLNFSKENAVTSLVIETFLLEKSRIPRIGREDRNYHIFYRVLFGLPLLDSESSDSLRLTYLYDFKILVSDAIDQEISSEGRKFGMLCDSLLRIGCTENDLKEIWKLLAAILHLGNIMFTQSIDDNQAAVADIPSTTLAHVSEMLGIDREELVRSLTTRTISVRSNTSIKAKILNISDCYYNTHSLMKNLYQCLFSWLGTLMNQANGNLFGGRETVKCIGILDLFGFETHGRNSLEQLCINYTSERLHWYFNYNVFKSEQDLYRQESIQFNEITYRDNLMIIDVMSKKPSGLLNVLDEYTLMSQLTDDMALLNHYHQLHGNHPHRVYTKPRFGYDPSFTIHHYAGPVTYRIDGFISKNSDTVPEDIIEVLDTTTNQFLCHIFKEYKNIMTSSSTEKIRSKSTLASKNIYAASISTTIRNEVDTLIHSLTNTDHQHILCFKPNNISSMNTFQSSMIIYQLRYYDMLHILRFKREQYHHKFTFQSFYNHYEILLRLDTDMKTRIRSDDCNDIEARTYCHLITDKYIPREYFQYGRKYIFIRSMGYKILNDILTQYLHHYATLIQKVIRRYLVYDMYREQLLLIHTNIKQFKQYEVIEKEILLRKQIKEQKQIDDEKKFEYARLKMIEQTQKYKEYSKEVMKIMEELSIYETNHLNQQKLLQEEYDKIIQESNDQQSLSKSQRGSSKFQSTTNIIDKELSQKLELNRQQMEQLSNESKQFHRNVELKRKQLSDQYGILDPSTSSSGSNSNTTQSSYQNQSLLFKQKLLEKKKYEEEFRYQQLQASRSREEAKRIQKRETNYHRLKKEEELQRELANEEYEQTIRLEQAKLNAIENIIRTLPEDIDNDDTLTTISATSGSTIMANDAQRYRSPARMNEIVRMRHDFEKRRIEDMKKRAVNQKNLYDERYKSLINDTKQDEAKDDQNSANTTNRRRRSLLDQYRLEEQLRVMNEERSRSDMRRDISNDSKRRSKSAGSNKSRKYDNTNNHVTAIDDTPVPAPSAPPSQTNQDSTSNDWGIPVSDWITGLTKAFAM